MTDKFFNAMGLSRRAKKLCVGHDEVKTSIKSGKAMLVILASDASERLEKEMTNLADEIPVIRTDATMQEMGIHIGKKSGVFSVIDVGLKDLVLSTIK
ncbi:MAG: ribosomal L7Ae/L30e/S12e/Gadd45 family protein [Clostridia bacterium]|nr:ribosomal L7Ae/L30e/S12e/Gadd45 family protein [Clostridia bacterium]